MESLRKPLAGMLALLFAAALGAQIQKPGDFDWYVLSLSWAPESSNGFVVQGFWPVSKQGKTLESCGKAKPVAKAIINLIRPYMPSAALVQHEWAQHGTCTGLTATDYFSDIMEARSAVVLPVQLTSVDGTIDESPGEVESQFAGSNPSFPPGAFRVSCVNGALSEVRVCFDKALNPQACPASLGECTAPSISIRGPR